MKVPDATATNNPTKKDPTLYKFNQWQAKNKVYYEKTTTDASFRKIFNASRNDIGPMTADFLTSILKIQFPKKDLEARKAEKTPSPQAKKPKTNSSKKKTGKQKIACWLT